MRYENKTSMEKSDKIVIFGCGGHARSIMNAVAPADRKKLLLVDSNALKGEVILDIPVYQQYLLGEKDKFIVGIGDNQKRAIVFLGLLEKYLKEQSMTVIANTASIGLASRIGKGTFIAHHAYIGPFSEIGSNTIVNTGSVVEHEAVIGNHVHLAPNSTVCGRCKIGNQVMLGAGAVIRNEINVCDNVIIGAGAVVIESITEPGKYVGVPACRL